jgi:hypothetical protein
VTEKNLNLATCALRLVVAYDDLMRRYTGPVSDLTEADNAEIDEAYDQMVAAARITLDVTSRVPSPAPEKHVAGSGNGAGQAKQPTHQEHSDSKAANDHTESKPDQFGDGIARSPREKKQHCQTDCKSSDSESHELSSTSHDHLIWKTNAFDQIVAVRAAHVEAVRAYNERLIFVRRARERGNHSMRLDDEYEAMSEAQATWHRTCQELADAALATPEGSEG